jgi:hypothetical protein
MEKDPEHFLARIKGRLPEQRRVLGVDLGTNCGVAWCDYDKNTPIDEAKITACQWSLAVAGYETNPLRHIRLKQFLSVLQPDLIGYEDVKFTPDKATFGSKGIGMIVARVASAAELLGGFKITLTTWAEERNIPAVGYAIGSIKKAATGKGNASKEAMIKAANKHYGVDLDPEDYRATGADNLADALHVCRMALEAYSKGIF